MILVFHTEKKEKSHGNTTDTVWKSVNSEQVVPNTFTLLNANGVQLMVKMHKKTSQKNFKKKNGIELWQSNKINSSPDISSIPSVNGGKQLLSYFTVRVRDHQSMTFTSLCNISVKFTFGFGLVWLNGMNFG